jgi:hypothetical protein
VTPLHYCQKPAAKFSIIAESLLNFADFFPLGYSQVSGKT